MCHVPDPMKIQIASDLHLEFEGGSNARLVEFVDRDLLILAGDICVGRGAEDFIAEHLMLSPVVYVPGNHEYYGSYARHELDAWWRDLADRELPDLHFLAMDEVVIDGVRIKGATWYSDFWGGDGRYAEWWCNDFHKPFNQPDNWSVDDHRLAHELETTWLEMGEKPDVVVTHFPPTLGAIADEFQDPESASGRLNSYFINDKEQLVRDLNPKLWISGHTHVPWDYMVGDCRVVGNPCGYPHESDLFNGSLVIEV